MIFADSQCRNGWLHRFNIVQQLENGVVERCEICGIKVPFRIHEGRINNKQYLSFHLRNALPKEHRAFAREYGQR